MPWNEINDPYHGNTYCLSNYYDITMAYVFLTYHNVQYSRWYYEIINGLKQTQCGPATSAQEAMRTVEKVLFDNGWKFMPDKLKSLL